MQKETFSRTARLLGQENMPKLEKARVLVFGVGGVGGYVCEGLLRSGVGNLHLVDFDEVAPSNINRQIIALRSTIGKKKTLAMKERAADINPEAVVTTSELFFSADGAEDIDFSSYDYVVDAVDSVKSKAEIIQRAKENGVPVICAMGAGNKLDPTAFRVADISKTKVCPLARAVRTELKKRGIFSGVKTVYSEELPIKRENEEGAHTPASVAFVPSVMGLIIASEVVKDLIK